MKRLWKKLICAVFGHRFFVVQNFHPGSRRIMCIRCKADFGMNDNARALLPWDPELEDMYISQGFDVKWPKFRGRS